jgi:hypothetical protein
LARFWQGQAFHTGSVSGYHGGERQALKLAPGKARLRAVRCRAVIMAID